MRSPTFTNERGATAQALVDRSIQSVDPEYLTKVKIDIARKRKRMTKAMLELFASVEGFRATSNIAERHAEAWLFNECGLSRTDMAVYRKFPQLPESARETIRLKHVMFETVKALVATDVETRAEALTRIDNGQVIDQREIRSIKRSIRDLRTTDQKAAQISLDNLVARAARRRAKAIQAELLSSALELVTELESFEAEHRGAFFDGSESAYYEYVHKNPTYETDRAAVTTLGAHTLQIFSSLFPGPHLSEMELLAEEIDGSDTADAHLLSRRHHCLENLSKGEFRINATGALVSGEDNPIALIASLLPTSQSKLGNVTPMHRPLINQERLERFNVRPVKTLTALELCAGAGGQMIGLSAANFRPVAVVDKSLHAARTLKQNNNDWKVLRKDFSEEEVKEILTQLGPVDLLAGGVPCQPFSSAGKRQGSKDERDMFPHAIDLVQRMRPKAFFFENVEGFSEKEFIETRLQIFTGLQDLGYTVGTFTVNAVQWGLAQRRKRVIVYGISKEFDARRFQIPVPVSDTNACFRDTIVDTLFPYLNSTDAKVVGEFTTEELDHYKTWANDWLDEYGNMSAPTITSWSPKNSEKVKLGWNKVGLDFTRLVEHPVRPDEVVSTTGLPPVTIPLLAKLQGFPDDWELSTSAPLKVKSTLLANAFPPILARVIGNQLHAVLSDEVISLEAAAREPIRKPDFTTNPPKRGFKVGPRIAFPFDPKRQKAYALAELIKSHEPPD